MAQLNLYVSDELAKRLKREARKANMPISRYVVSLLSITTTGDLWPAGYFDGICGFLQGDFPEPADPLAEAVDTEGRP